MSTAVFNSLPSLTDARGVIEMHGEERIVEELKGFFRGKNMDRSFGAVIAHRHFELEKNNWLVHSGNAATPWSKEMLDEVVSEPTPTMWTTIHGKIEPLEYRFPGESELTDTEREFMLEFEILQVKMGIPHLFALCRYPGDDFKSSCEYTSGNVLWTVDLEWLKGGVKNITTTYFFSPKLYKRGCRCVCSIVGGGHTGHSRHVITQSG